MPKMIFVNLAVANVAQSTAFFESLGAARDARLCDETTSMMSFSEAIHFMLLSRERFQSFTSKAIADSRTTSEALLCLSEDSRAGVDQTVARAVAAGGKADPNPSQDYGYMYGRSFEDLDGHTFEVVWMDVEAAMRAATSPSNAA